MLHFDALQETTQEGGGAEHEGDLMGLHQFRQLGDFQGARVSDERVALDDRKPQGHGATERVEEGQAAEDFIFSRQTQTEGKLGDVANNIPVAEGHAFGFAGAATGENQGGFLIASHGAETEHFSKKGLRENLEGDQPLHYFGLQPRQDALNKHELLGGGPGKGLGLPDKGIGSDEAVDAALADGAFDGFLAGGEVEIDGDFPSEDRSHVGDQPSTTGSQDNADAGLGGFFFNVFGEGGRRRKNLRVGSDAAIQSIDNLSSGSMFFKACQQHAAE